MLRTAIFFNLAWVLSFCIAVPQSTLKNVSPGALQIPRDVPENGAIIAGVMNSMWTIDEQDIAYLVVINDYKNKQLVRQSACVRNHLRTNIKARVFTPCIDLTGYTFIEGEFTFDSFSRIEAYLANIFENADYFMQSWTISYPYPSTTTTTFEPELRGAIQPSRPVVIHAEDFQCRFTKKDKKKECIWIPKPGMSAEFSPYNWEASYKTFGQFIDVWNGL